MAGWIRSVTIGALAVGVVTSPAFAKMRPEAQQLYDGGKADLEAGRSDAASFKLRRALALVERGTEDHWLLLVALALAAEKAERPLDALEYFGEFIRHSNPAEHEVSPKWLARHKRALTTAAALETRLLQDHGKVRLTSEPPGAAIKVDGVPIGAELAARTPFVAYLPSGPHQIELELAGHARDTRSVQVSAGGDQEVTAALMSLDATAKTAPAPPVEPPQVEPSVVAIEPPAAVQAALDPKLPKEEGHRQYTELRTRFERDQTLAGVFLGVGAAAAVASTLLLIVAGSSSGEGDVQVMVAPTAAGAAGIMRARF
jgi:hypothetical protein